MTNTHIASYAKKNFPLRIEFLFDENDTFDSFFKRIAEFYKYFRKKTNK